MNYIQQIHTKGDFPLVAGGRAADIYVCPEEDLGVVRAASDLKEDIIRVTGVSPRRLQATGVFASNVVIIGTIGRCAIIDQLIEEGKLDGADKRGKWEAFVLQVVENPIPGVKQALVIAGSDKRGTIFGIYDLSEHIGVSPWYWWADVEPFHQDTLFVRKGAYKQGEPSVRYRGIFLNDEGPSLMTWVRANYKDFVHQFYEKVFELILRLKGNYLWPAMWDNAFNEDDPLNPVMADLYGIVMGTSHHEPMMRAHGEWKKHKKGPWDYGLNEDFLYKFWEEGIRRNQAYENIVTLGMRGDGDEPMGGSLSFEEKIQLLQKIVRDQRKIIEEHINTDVVKVPQLWALYKEVQDYYENGMRVPEDITLLWSDDNHGNLRRAPTEEERKRSGGAGIYYHLDYVGGPRSYKWINTVPLQKIWEQMHKAYAFGADRIWIVNVGDLKPMELPTEFFLRMAWDRNAHTKDNVWNFTVAWSKRQFGEAYGEEIAHLLATYTKFNGRLKPELINHVESYSLIHYKEAEKVLGDFQEVTKKAENIYESLPEHQKDAFFQLVLFPVKASAQITELYIQVARNHLYQKQGRTATNRIARIAEQLFAADKALTLDYNKRMAFGKWDHMMDQTHIGYTYWNHPPENTMPNVYKIPVKKGAQMGVAIEGSDLVWPIGGEECILPPLDGYTRERRYIEIFNKKSDPFGFTAITSEKWIQLSLAEGWVFEEKRIWIDIDWEAVPRSECIEGSIEISSSSGERVIVQVPVVYPKQPERNSLEGFIETSGYISIEAEHFTNKIDCNGAGWQKIDGYGRTLSSMAVFPVTVPGTIPPENSPCLEYRIYVRNPGEMKVTALIAPSLDFIPGQGLRLGISFDDQEVQIMEGIKKEEEGGFCEKDWEESVIYNIQKLHSIHPIGEVGYHTLKIWMVDPIVVLQKILVDTGGLKPSYLGPPESYYGGKKECWKEETYPSFDPLVIPRRIEVGDWEESFYANLDCYDVFAEEPGIYEVEIIPWGNSQEEVLHMEIDGRNIIESVENATEDCTNITESAVKKRIALEEGNHHLKIYTNKGAFGWRVLSFALIQKDIFDIRPTLRLNPELGSESLIAQIEICNRDQISRQYITTVSLYDDQRNLIDAVTGLGRIPRDGSEMLQYCFEWRKEVEMYMLKIELAYDTIEREFCFLMKSPCL